MTAPAQCSLLFPAFLSRFFRSVEERLKTLSCYSILLEPFENGLKFKNLLSIRKLNWNQAPLKPGVTAEDYSAIASSSGYFSEYKQRYLTLVTLCKKWNYDLQVEPVINNESCIHNRYFSLLQFFPKLNMGWFINYSFC